MKRFLLLLALLSLACEAARAQGVVSLNMGQPGFYGRIDIGSQEPPPLLFPNAIMGNPGVFSGQPIYMHVPPQHAYYWSSHCQLYGACDSMVYFVQSDWYNRVYVPGFRSGVYGYAPYPVYVAPPVYVPRPYYYGRPNYGHHHPHDRHHDHHAGPPYQGGHDGRHHRRHSHDGHGHRPDGSGKPHGGGHSHGGHHGQR